MDMTKKTTSGSKKQSPPGKPSALLDTRVIYCGDNLEQLKKLPDNCVDLIYIDPPFNSVALSGNNGGLVEKYSYDVFGAVTICDTNDQILNTGDWQLMLPLDKGRYG